MSITLPQKQLSSGISPSAQRDMSEVRRLGRAEQQRAAAIGNLGQAVASGLMKYGEMTAQNLSNQEIFQGELAYKKGMDDHDLMLATSQDMEVIKNADKLTEAESDRLQADIFSKPIYKRSRQELEQTFAAQKQSRVLKSKINSYDRVAQNFHAMVPTMTETYAADTVHGDIRFAEMMSENAPLISEAQRVAYTNQYKLQKGVVVIGNTVADIREIDNSFMARDDFEGQKELVADGFSDLRVTIESMEGLDTKGRKYLNDGIDVEEATLERERAAKFKYISEETHRQLIQDKWDSKLTADSVQTAYDKKFISPELYNSFKTGMLSKVPPSESQMFTGYMESRDAVTAWEAGTMSFEEASGILSKNVALGFLDGAVGRSLYDTLRKPPAKINTPNASIKTDNIRTIDNYIDSFGTSLTADFVEGGEAELEQKKVLVKARAHDIYHKWADEQIKDNPTLDRTKATEKAVEIMRQMESEASNKRAKDFFKTPPPKAQAQPEGTPAGTIKGKNWGVYGKEGSIVLTEHGVQLILDKFNGDVKKGMEFAKQRNYIIPD